MDILAKIVERKKAEVVAAKKRIPENLLRTQALESGERRPFLERLERSGPPLVNIIAEIKRASPSKGVIRSDLNPIDYATAYEQGGAAALSVLTDQTFFQGSFEDLQHARNATLLPVLRKDFLISSYQLYESAVMGADAILLIVRILSREQLKDYIALGHDLGLDALVEIHTEADLEIATDAGAKLIGINNRNLQTFETNIDTAVHLKSLLKPDQIAVSESGIHTREDIQEIYNSGIRNFLIGESLVRAKNPKDFLKSLLAS